MWSTPESAGKRDMPGWWPWDGKCSSLRRREVLESVTGWGHVGFLARARTVLWFRLDQSSAIMPQGFSYCWAGLAQRQGHLCWSLCPLSSGWGGGAEVWEGTQPRPLTWTDQGDVPPCVMSWLAVKPGEGLFQTGGCWEQSWEQGAGKSPGSLSWWWICFRGILK